MVLGLIFYSTGVKMKRHTLTTPKVETKTIDTYKIYAFSMGNMLNDTLGPTAVIQLSQGQMVEEEYVQHEINAVPLNKAVLEAELDKTVQGGDTVREALEKAIFAALVANGDLDAGTVA